MRSAHSGNKVACEMVWGLPVRIGDRFEAEPHGLLDSLQVDVPGQEGLPVRIPGWLISPDANN